MLISLLRAGLALLLGSAALAYAHVPAGYDLRAIHFVQSSDGLHGYFRLTFPLAVAKGMGAKRPDGFFEPPPFTVLRVESAHAFYYPDAALIRRSPLDLARLIADGHRLESAGQAIRPDIMSARVYPKGYVVPFNDLDQARKATAPGEAYPVNAPQVDAAFVVVDAHYIYPHHGAEFRLSSTLSNRIIGQTEIQNLIVDHRPEGDIIYRTTGPMSEPLLINPSRWSAIKSFVILGAEHVLSGTDHLLLILCVTLGAVGAASLAWRVTGFTLGHSVSLALGFWGYVPSAAWFVPAVEATIAFSILVAGLSLVFKRVTQRGLFVIIVLVGFVHGLGFSFGLRELLDTKGPHVWASLASFNVGVEIGQILFALAIVVVGFAVSRRNLALKTAAYRAVAALCAGVSIYWMFERLRPIFV